MPKLYLLPTAQTRDKSTVTPEQMIKLLGELKSDPEGFDYIILDCQLVLNRASRDTIAGADRALVIHNT